MLSAHSTYGDYIDVVRRLHRDGSGTYRLLNARGRVVSQRKQDLIQITDNMNLQIENPVCVLTQDMSRQFLQKSDPSSCYKVARTSLWF